MTDDFFQKLLEKMQSISFQLILLYPALTKYNSSTGNLFDLHTAQEKNMPKRHDPQFCLYGKYILIQKPNLTACKARF